MYAIVKVEDAENFFNYELFEADSPKAARAAARKFARSEYGIEAYYKRKVRYAQSRQFDYYEIWEV